jgi:hypothetical protein
MYICVCVCVCVCVCIICNICEKPVSLEEHPQHLNSVRNTLGTR